MQRENAKGAAFIRSAQLFIGFVGVGALNTISSFLLYELLIVFMPYWLAYALCFPVGIAFLLFANAGLVFGHRVSLTSGTAFVSIYLASYGVGFAGITVLVELIGVPPALAPLAVIIVMTPLNFMVSRRVLERKMPKNSD